MDWSWLLTEALLLDPGFLDRLRPAIAANPQNLQAALAMAMVGTRSDNPKEPQIVGDKALVFLTGLLTNGRSWSGYSTSYGDFQDAFRKALDANASEAWIISDSPGGQATGAPETSDLVYRSRGVKPIKAVAVYGQMCSAAYYVASAADKLYATRGARVGSIGCAFVHQEFSEYDKRLGITSTVLRMPANKYLGNDVEPLSDAAKKTLLSNLIEPSYRQFMIDVARNRGTSVESVAAKYGGGLSLPADQALAAGMLDGLVDWPDVIQAESGTNTKTFFAPATPGTMNAGQAAPAAGPPGTTASQPPAGTLETRERSQEPPAGQQGVTAPGSPISQGGHPVKYSQKLRAWLFAADLIAAVEASDELIGAVLAGHFAARGVAVPEDSDAILSALKAHSAPAVSAIQARAAPLNLAQTGGSMSQADVDAAVLRAMQGEDTRRAGIQQRATLLGLAADAPELAAALSNRSITPEAFANGVLNTAITTKKPLAVTPRGIEAGEAAAEKFAEAATFGLLLRSEASLVALATSDGVTSKDAAQKKLAEMVKGNPQIREVAQMSWPDIMRTCVELSGQRLQSRSPTDIAQAFVKLQGTEERQFAAGHPRIDPLGMQMGGGPFVGPGDFPGIMDGVMRKIVEYALSVAPVTYPEWSSRMPDAENFQPQELRELGYKGNLPEHIDGQDYDQWGLLASTLGFIQVAEYGDELTLSWRTALSDPMDYLIQGLGQQQIAHERTLCELLVNLLVGGVSPITGKTIYHADHHNSIGSTAGGGPSLAQGKAMRKLLQQQKLVTDPLREAGLDLAIALVGSEWWTDAQLAFLDTARLNWQAMTEGTVSPFKGTVTPYYEPLLSGFGDGKTWYGAANPNLFVKGIRYRFLGGFGPGGRRDAYYDPKSICQHYRIRGCFGGILHHHECFVSNVGYTTPG